MTIFIFQRSREKERVREREKEDREGEKEEMREKESERRMQFCNTKHLKTYLLNMLLQSPIYLEKLKVRNIPRKLQNILDLVQPQGSLG